MSSFVILYDLSIEVGNTWAVRAVYNKAAIGSIEVLEDHIHQNLKLLFRDVNHNGIGCYHNVSNEECALFMENF